MIKYLAIEKDMISSDIVCRIEERVEGWIPNQTFYKIVNCSRKTTIIYKIIAINSEIKIVRKELTILFNQKLKVKKSFLHSSFTRWRLEVLGESTIVRK